MAIADRIVVMNAGRIEDDGPPEQVYLRPRSLFSASFMGEVNLIPVANGQAPFGPALPGSGTLCLRPEAIGREGPLRIGPSRLDEAAFFGTHIRARFVPLAAPDLPLIVHLPQGAEATPGLVVELFARGGVVL